MRLDGQEESENVEDRRGMMSGTGGMLAGGGGLIVLIIALFLGINPAKLSQFIGQGSGPQTNNPSVAPNRSADPEEEKQAHFTKVIFGDTEAVWSELFRKMGREYPKPTLVLFTGQVDSACGQADAAVGPFYCGGDHRVYIDLSFYKDMQRQLNAPGDFAHAYVVAHEVGHHVQRLLGYSERARDAKSSGDTREAHHVSVRLELQADYLAGVWAYHAQKKYNFLEKGDVESALRAAFEIGDDRLQNKARGTIVPDAFTHGTSKQRMYWFNRGFTTGDVQGAAALFDLPYEKL